MDERSLSVSALTRVLSMAVEQIGPVRVRGELSQCRVSANGHLYATLKDEQALINLVMWRSTLRRQAQAPREGDVVEVRGSVEIYPPRGSYQLVASRITPAGSGDLAARLEALKQGLLAEGLFDEDRKQPLPFLPRAVGIATAAGSAALADIIDSIRRRFPAMPIVHAPCPVQGAQAEAGIIAALARLDAHPDVDVIIVGRGGGSLEDLWAFNLEGVVRAIAACRHPVISAVGHETDLTLADLVADCRAKTPTEAGCLVVPERTACDQILNDHRRRLNRAIDALVHQHRQRLEALATHRALVWPQQIVNRHRQRLDDLHHGLDSALEQALRTQRERLDRTQRALHLLYPGRRLRVAREATTQLQLRLNRAANAHLIAGQQRLRALVGRLDALSPLAVIARGYSLILNEDGSVVTSHDQVQTGQTLRCRLSDGWIDTQVTGQQAERLGEARILYDPNPSS